MQINLNIVMCTKLTIAFLLLSYGCIPQGPKWPKLQPVKSIFEVPEPYGKTHIRFALKDTSGEIRYTVICRGGTELQQLEDAPENIIWVEPFACRLFAGVMEQEYSLLAHDASAPWHTRGQIKSYEELKDEKERIRSFRLRGFEITFAFLDVKFDVSGMLQPFRLSIRVEPDESIAPEYVESNALRVCRSIGDETFGSWERCRKGGRGTSFD